MEHRAITVDFPSSEDLRRELENNIKHRGISFIPPSPLHVGSEAEVVIALNKEEVASCAVKVAVVQGETCFCQITDFSDELVKKIESALQVKSEGGKNVKKISSTAEAGAPLVSASELFEGVDDSQLAERKAEVKGVSLEEQPDADGEDRGADETACALQDDTAFFGSICAAVPSNIIFDPAVTVEQLTASKNISLPFHSVFLSISILKKSGVLKVESENRVKEIFIDAGIPVRGRASSLKPEESLAWILISSGLLKRLQYERAVAECRKSGREFGEVLVEQGTLKQPQLIKARKEHAAAFMKSMFFADKGEFLWAEGEKGDKFPFPFDARSEGIAYRCLIDLSVSFNSEDVMSVLSEFKDKTPALEVSRLSADDLMMNEREERFYKKIAAGGKKVSELLDSGVFPPDEAAKIILVLAGCKVVSLI